MQTGLHNRVSSWLSSARAEHHLAGRRAPHHQQGSSQGKVPLRLEAQPKPARFHPRWGGFLAPCGVKLALSDTSWAIAGSLAPNKRTHVCVRVGKGLLKSNPPPQISVRFKPP